MKRLGTVVAAVALAWASSASSATMVAKIWGDWNDNPNWNSWWMEISYDTSSFDPETNDGEFFATTDVHYAKGAFLGETCSFFDPPDCVSEPVVRAWSLGGDEISFLSTSQTDGWYELAFSGPDVNVVTRLLSNSAAFYRPDERHYISTFWGDYTGARIGDIGFGSIHTHIIDVSPVPEPATWAMMIVGFCLAGAGLRSARSQSGFGHKAAV